MKSVLKTFYLLLTAISLLFTCLSSQAMFGYKFGFIDSSLNYLQWTPGTKQRSGLSSKEPGKNNKVDLPYLELEGGAEFSWGDLYGFADLERFLNNSNLRHSALKGATHLYLPFGHTSLYGQIYDYRERGFFEQNRVIGIGYQFDKSHFWFKPWIGIHYVDQTFYSGSNGGMAGWVLNYDFMLNKQKLLLTNWHEIEFLRAQQMALANGGSTGINGAVALWWQLNKHLTVGGQWRYAYNKLGQKGAISAAIATIKYFFDLPRPSLEE